MSLTPWARIRSVEGSRSSASKYHRWLDGGVTVCGLTATVSSAKRFKAPHESKRCAWCERRGVEFLTQATDSLRSLSFVSYDSISDKLAEMRALSQA